MSDLENLGNLLNILYDNDASVKSLEKTAEANLFAALQDNGQISEVLPTPAVDLKDLSTEDLIKLAQELDNDASVTGDEKPAAEKTPDEEVPDLLEKTAEEMLGGQIMAHSMVHEFSLIKTAMSQGLCRVCKETPMDVDGSSVCSNCVAQVEEAA